MAGDFGADKATGPVRPSGTKRQTGLPDVIIHRIASQDWPSGTGERGQGRLLPTPDTGCSPNGHGRRGGLPGNGHQSGHGLDVAATALSHAPASRAGASPVAWGECEPAIRRWEGVLARPAPPPAEPGPSGRPRLSAAFAEWMMGLAPGFVTGVPGIPRTRQLKIIGNGVVPQQAALALRLLISAAAIPAVPARRHAGRRMNRPVPGPSAPHGRAPCPPGIHARAGLPAARVAATAPRAAGRTPAPGTQPGGAALPGPAAAEAHLTVPPRGLPRAAAPPPHPA